MQIIAIIPLKGMVELKGFEVYFEATENDPIGWSELPDVDWAVDKVVSMEEGTVLSAKNRCDFAYQYRTELNELISTYCRQSRIESEADYLEYRLADR